MLSHYLQSQYHRAGCIGAIIACVLVLMDLLNSYWLLDVFGFYSLGAVLVFAKELIFDRRFDLEQEEEQIQTLQQHPQQQPPLKTNSHNTTPTVQFDAPIHDQLLDNFRSLEQHTRPHLNHKSKQLMNEIDEIMLFMREKMQQSDNNQFKFEISDIQRTMTAYLSPALQHFCNLPTFLRDRSIQGLDKTPHQLLEQQLAMILEALKQIAESIYINDLNQVIDHGQFLKHKLQQQESFKIEL